MSGTTVKKASYAVWKRGGRCKKCFVDSRRNDFNDVKNNIENNGHKLISSEYINSYSKLEVECNNGHRWKARYGNLKNGSGCPYCVTSKRSSKPEKEVQEIVKSLIKENVICNDRTQILNPKTGRYLELDIWIPSINKAIEFNGEYFHNNDETKYRDKQKVIQCKELGIDFLIVNDTNWYNDKELCIYNIKKFLNV